MLTSSFAKREVWVDVGTPTGVARIGPYLVNPPTVKTAIIVLETSPRATSNDDYWFALVDGLREWLPVSFWSRLTGKNGSRALTCTIAPNLLLRGTDLLDKVRLESLAERAKERAESLGWGRIMADYRSTYKSDPLVEPWGYFLEQLDHLDLVRARYEVSVLRSIAAVLSTEKGLVDDVLDRAGWGPPPKSDEEREAEQMKNLSEIGELFGSWQGSGVC